MSSQLSTSFQLVFYFDLDFRIIDMEPIGRYCSFDKELFDICRARYVVIRISTQLNVQSKRLWQLNVCHDILTSLFFLTKVLICEWRQTMTVPMQCILYNKGKPTFSIRPCYDGGWHEAIRGLTLVFVNSPKYLNICM